METQVKLNGKVVPERFPILPPHRILEHLINTVGLRLSLSVVNKFWEHLEEMGDPWACNSEAARGRFWPVGLYGDEATLYENNNYQKVVCVFLNLPLFRLTSVRCTRYLVFAIRSEIMVTPAIQSLRPILAAITDSLNYCYDGLDELGNVLFPENTRCCVSELRGDQAWHRLLFNHRSYWGAKNVCFMCRANTSTRHYTQTSLWRGTERNTPQFLVEELPGLLCALQLQYVFLL